MQISNPIKLGGLTYDSNRKTSQSQNTSEGNFKPKLPVLNQDQFISFKAIPQIAPNNNTVLARTINSSADILIEVGQILLPKSILGPSSVTKMSTNSVAKHIAKKCRESADILIKENNDNPLSGILNGLDGLLDRLSTAGRIEEKETNLVNTAVDLFESFKADPIKFPKTKNALYTPSETNEILSFIKQSPNKLDEEIVERTLKLKNSDFAVIYTEEELLGSKLPQNLIDQGAKKISENFSLQTFTKAPGGLFVAV